MAERTRLTTYRNSDKRVTYSFPAGYNLDGFAPIFYFRAGPGDAPTLTVQSIATPNGSNAVVVGDSVVLTLKADDLATFGAADTYSGVYDSNMPKSGFVNKFVGGPHVQYVDGSYGEEAFTDSVLVEVMGVEVPIILEGGNIGAAAAVAVKEAVEAADSAAQSASTAQTAAATAVAATINKADLNGSNILGANQAAFRGAIVAAADAFVQSGSDPATLTLQTKLRQGIAVQDFGLTNLDKVNNAYALAGRSRKVENTTAINVGTGVRPTNTVGAVPEGLPIYYVPTAQGGISGTTVGGREVWTLPGRDQPVWGLDYLFARWLQTLEVGGSPKVILVSDSTGAGYQGAQFQALMARYPSLVFVNNSVSGSTLEQWRTSTGLYGVGQPGDGKGLAATMTADPDLLIVGFDTNAAYVSGQTAEQAIASRRSAYTTIRAHANGSVQSCSLVTLTLASMNDGTTGASAEQRDQYWAQTLQDGIRAVCVDFQSAFFSQYELYPDAAWTDFVSGPAQNLVLDINRVHPLNAYSKVLAQDLFNFVVPETYRSLFPNPSTAVRVPFGVAAAFNLPGNDEDCFTRPNGTMATIGGYIQMNTPAALTAGTLLGTVTLNHRPRINNYRNVLARVWNNSGGGIGVEADWEDLNCTLATNGQLTVIKPGVKVPTRIWIYGVWEIT